jgi:hypothetical protein
LQFLYFIFPDSKPPFFYAPEQPAIRRNFSYFLLRSADAENPDNHLNARKESQPLRFSRD